MDNKISLKTYIKSMDELYYYKQYDKYIGFSIKYYPYDKLNTIDNIKLKYI